MSRRVRLLALGAIPLLGLVALFVVGGSLSQPVPAPIDHPPASLAAKPVEFPSASGSTIRGWFAPGTQCQGAVLLLPGVRANRLSMTGRAELLGEAGYSALLIDFQATGQSEGDAITFGWRERLDVLAAVSALRQLAPCSAIGIIGTSLGGAAALLALPELQVDGIVLEAVYPTIDAAVRNRLAMRLGAAGAMLSPVLLAQFQIQLGIAPSDLRPVDRIAQARCPLLVIGGMRDRHTTPADTRVLYDAAREPKELWLIADAGHEDYLVGSGVEYRSRVLSFFDRSLRR